MMLGVNIEIHTEVYPREAVLQSSAIENLSKLAEHKLSLISQNLGVFPGLECAEIGFQRDDSIKAVQANELVACGVAGHASAVVGMSLSAFASHFKEPLGQQREFTFL